VSAPAGVLLRSQFLDLGDEITNRDGVTVEIANTYLAGKLPDLG
jgi:hypothetical protein